MCRLCRLSHVSSPSVTYNFNDVEFSRVVVCRATGETWHSHESLNTRFYRKSVSSEPFYNFTKQFLTSAADSHLNLSTITRSKPPWIPPQSGEFCFNLLDVSLCFLLLFRAYRFPPPPRRHWFIVCSIGVSEIAVKWLFISWFYSQLCLFWTCTITFNL